MKTDLLDGLNNEQKAAVTHAEGPLLIVAGAGTGKTTVITKRIAWLIETGKCRPDEILALTFTDKAAGEMEERIDRLLPYGYVNVWISTFHAFCERILKSHALDIGLPNSFRLFNTTASWILIRQNLDRFNLEYYRPLGNPTKFIHALISHFSRAKDEALSPEEYAEYARTLGSAEGAQDETARITEIAHAYATYEQLLLENDALDFGNLIVFTLKLLRERPSILELYRKQFKYILVDEFQDTNWAQYELVKLLAGNAHNITVVGDDDQAVYKFRGASLANILQFKNDFPESAEIFLKKNYRSRQNILDLSYSFIQQNNPNRLEVQLNEGETKGSLTKRLEAPDDTLGEIKHMHCATHEDEATAVTQKILELHEGGASWDSCAILVRSNDSATHFISACEMYGIPYQFVNIKGLYSKPVILDALAYMRVCMNYYESASLFRCLHMPILRLAPTTLIELNHYAHQKGVTLWQSLSNAEALALIPEADREVLRVFVERTHEHVGLARTLRVPDLLIRIMTDIGYLAHLSAAGTVESQESLQYLVQLHKKITAFQEADPSLRLGDFLVYMRMEQEAGERGTLPIDIESGPDTVKIMTIHASKGLEFDHVFLVHLVDRRFPTTEREDAIEIPATLIKETLTHSDDAHLEEERRLFYVAATRARQGLYFTSAEDYGGSRKKKRSQFLHEIGFGEEVAGEPPRSYPRSALSIPVPKSPIAPAIGTIAKELSFSRLAAFQKCPMQYKFAYILSIPTFQMPSAVFGKAIHKTLQEYLELLQRTHPDADLFSARQSLYTKEDLPSLEVLFELYEKNIPTDWYARPETKEEYVQRGRQMVARFHGDASKMTPQPFRLEYPFRMKIAIGEDFFILKGQIDRIDKIDDEKVAIIDYKTGKSKQTLKSDDREQLILYAMAVENEFKKKVAKCTYWYLEDGTQMDFEVKEKDSERVIKKVTETISKIRESDFAATPDKNTCTFCDFREICEFRKI